MTLKQLLRQDFTSYVKPHFEKSECEVCGSETEHLHVHHMTHFQDLLNETLEQLNLEYYENTDDYTEEELRLIRDVMIAKQMRIEYVTCCEPCHLELHDGTYNPHIKDKNKMSQWAYKANETKRQKKQIEHMKHVNEIKEYLPSLVDVKLDKEQRNKLVEKLNVRGKNGELRKTVKPINAWLMENGFDFIIESKRVGRKKITIWIIKNLNKE